MPRGPRHLFYALILVLHAVARPVVIHHSVDHLEVHMARKARDTYMELIRRFPLKTIKNDDEHAQATAMVSELIGRHLDRGSGDYLDALIVFVNKYEDEHHAINEDMTPQEALRALMESNDLSQADI